MKNGAKNKSVAFIFLFSVLKIMTEIEDSKKKKHFPIT